MLTASSSNGSSGSSSARSNRGRARSSLAVPIQNLELQEAGRYDWLVKIDGDLVERIPMAVFLLPQPPGAVGPPK
jgi:hypothetical protein